MSDGPEGSKWMRVDRPAGTTFRDRAGHVRGAVAVNAEGHAEFRCQARSVSVWVEDERQLSRWAVAAWKSRLAAG